jgi:phosphatidylethanolamine-binding protein (PEBP) family uncharacterized protein
MSGLLATRAGLGAVVTLALACSSEPGPAPSAPGPGSAGGSSGAAASGGGLASSAGMSGAAGSAGMGGAAGSAGAAMGGAAGSAGAGSAFVLTSPALDDVAGCSVDNPSPCDVFPDANVSYMGNANVSPELHWSGAPPGTMSFALVLFDATFGQAHWALWNIPSTLTGLAADVPKDTATPAAVPGSRQANANFATTGGDGYFGPHVPCNVFELQLYALSVSSLAPMSPDSAVLVSIELQELGDTVLGVAKLTGRSNDYMMACQ